jgi:hypothetical protein
MGREVHRVPHDFDWPLNKVWEGFLTPDHFDEERCPDCKSGYSPQAQNLYELWYGKLPFDPSSTGSAPWQHDTPGIRAVAERNTRSAPEFYGTGEAATVREAQRLADLFNSQWSHHLSQDDVEALVAAERLHDFTHTWSREEGWQKIDPPVKPTAEQINEWSLTGFGHDGLNAYVVIEARCERESIEPRCPTQGARQLGKVRGPACSGRGVAADQPAQGRRWQLWETVSEGSPISPVFTSADELAGWMSDPARGNRWVPPAAAANFIADGWAPSFVSTASTGVVSGVEWVGHHTDEGQPDRPDTT